MTRRRRSPFACGIPMQDGFTLDAVLIGESDLAILFSYTRAYFRVDAPATYRLVQWLRQLMPDKRMADLYNAIGYNRHAQDGVLSRFRQASRDVARSLRRGGRRRGMVMLVFTLPSYDVVFKLIRDRFDAPKESDRRDVMGRYRMVFEHDRAGRLVEAHEFEHLRIARDRFEPSLLEDLLRNAGRDVRIEGDDVLIAHAYVERRVRPLNLLFRECDEATAIAAACDYAQSIKDLAASNIFAGDLLTKNFGLTRRGRVVFYDYDELCLLTDCNFRKLPQPQSYDEEMAAEPWFSVRDNDIFPEEFPRFLAFPIRRVLVYYGSSPDTLRPFVLAPDAGKTQGREIPEVFPYKTANGNSGVATEANFDLALCPLRSQFFQNESLAEPIRNGQTLQ